MANVVKKHSISAELAQKMLAKAVAKARELGVSENVAVLDDGGNLKAFRRMDGAPILSIEIAQNKAPQAPRGVVGSGQVTATTFAIPAGSAAYWRSHLSKHGVSAMEAGERFGETVVAIADPDGLPLELVATRHANPGLAWQQSPVDREHAICGFHSATLSEEGYEQTARLLTDTMGFSLVGNEGNRFRYQTGAGGPRAEGDVLGTPDGLFGRLGTGALHHIAWRTPDDAQQLP